MENQIKLNQSVDTKLLPKNCKPEEAKFKCYMSLK